MPHARRPAGLRLERGLVRLALLVLHALLGRGLVGGGHDLDHRDRAARLLDRLARTGGDAGDGEGERSRKLALAEHAHAVLAAAREADRLEPGMVDRGPRLELAGID